jgi:phage recombination protein Bet
VDPEELKVTLKATAFKECKTDAEFMAAVIIANTYGLNPILREIYAFPSQKGVVPIVPIDGWVSLVNRQENHDGVELIENEKDGKLISVTSKFYLKDKEHPVVVTERLDECKKGTDTWNKWPYRMLRHKAYIQGARIAHGFSGIYDEDEAERIVEAQLVESSHMKPDVQMPQAKAPETPDQDPAEAPAGDEIDTPNDAIEPEITSIPDLLALPVGGKQDIVQATLVTFSKRTVKKKAGGTSDITDYVVSGDGKSATISMWGDPIAGAESGLVMEFRTIVVTEFKGELKYSAKEVTIIGTASEQ